MSAVGLALIGCGGFFLAGMLTGVWKYRCIMQSPQAQAPVYVDICHRTALMYAFASLVLAEFAGRSVWPAWINLLGVAAPLSGSIVTANIFGARSGEASCIIITLPRSSVAVVPDTKIRSPTRTARE